MSRYLHIWEDEDGNNKEVILKTLFAYGMGDFASNLCWTFIGSYLSVFYTDAVGLAPAIASAIMLIAKIWDGVNDPMFGVIAERTNTKKGRFRPYIFYGAPFLAIFSVLALSGKSVLRMMNSLFQVEYNLDSKIVFGETESVNDKLKSKRSDKILTINGKDCYHVEVQSTPDNTMILRVFEYGFQHAKNNWRVGKNLKFPASKIIYLCKNTGDSIRKLKLHFQDQGTFSYYVEIFDLLAFSAEELDKRRIERMGVRQNGRGIFKRLRTGCRIIIFVNLKPC